ncbi:MAG: phasin family protein [Burkholderiaceae bacterium]|nr:phasin family protein [Burkholderiaceae bacterium]
MAQRNAIANPLAGFYEAQTASTAELVQAALNGMQRLQQLTLEAMRTGAGGQFSIAQSMATMRDGGDVNRAVSEAAGPVAEQGARYQREMLQAISDMNSELVRASYSMMERMRKAVSDAAQGMPMAMPAMPGMTSGNDAMANPMALYDAAMRQWQTAVQQMMEASPMGMGAGGGGSMRGTSQTEKGSTKPQARKNR